MVSRPLLLWGETMDAVERYRKRRDRRLRERGNKRQTSTTKLPFGLCMKEGIEIGKDWGPSEAWEALAKKGITPEKEYAKRKGSEKSNSSGNPNDDVKRTASQKSLGGFDKHRKEKIKSSFVNNLSPQEKKETAEMLSEVFNNGSYRVVRSPGSFGGIMLNGFKNQMETGTSGEGSGLNKDLRRKFSENMFGHSGLEDSDYEKYGYLGFADDKKDQDDLGKPEGGVTYTLKKDRMADRTTYTFGDSLNTKNDTSTPGYAGEKPTIEGMSSLGNEERVRSALKAYKDFKNGKIDYDEMFNRIRDDADNMYIELQFHGPVTSDDIESVSFSSKAKMIGAFTQMSNSYRMKIIEDIKKKKIGLRYMDDNGSFVDGMRLIEDEFY